MRPALIAEKVITHIYISGCDDVVGRPFFPDRWDKELLSDSNWQAFFKTEIGGALTRVRTHKRDSLGGWDVIHALRQQERGFERVLVE